MAVRSAFGQKKGSREGCPFVLQVAGAYFAIAIAGGFQVPSRMEGGVSFGQ